MNKTAIIGVAAAALGVFAGTKLPSGNAGYVVITGTTKNREAAKEYFDKAPDYVKKTCGADFLVLDRKTDIREGSRRGDNGPLTLIARFHSKQAAIDCYESAEYQSLLPIRKPHTNWNFRITEGKK